MMNRLIATFLFCGIFAFLHAQNTSFTKQSDKYFSQKEFETLFKESSIKVAADYDFPESIFADIYEAHKEEIIASAAPLISKKFKWIENGYSTNPKPGSEAFTKRKKLYEKEFYRGVRDAIQNNSDLRKKLFTWDENDRILFFNSYVKVNEDGKIQVTETIRVYNGNGKPNLYGASATPTNDQIQRGIVRDFPTKYFTPWKFSSKVGFRLLGIQKNGEKEPYNTERLNNGIRFYIGQSDYYLERGVYEYEIQYETNRQLIFHPDKDELYWNVTGNGWSFQIERARCEIEFPAGAKIKEWSCYTGQSGSKEKFCRAGITADHKIVFENTLKLHENEGLTVAVSIDKGVLTPPGAISVIYFFLKDNWIIPALFLAILLLFLINLWGWFKVGRDPKPGLIIPQFEPPQRMSPADVGYLYLQKFEDHLFASALVDLAVKKRMIIEVTKGGIFSKNQYHFKRPLKYIYDGDETARQWYDFEPVDLFDETIKSGQYNAKIAKCYSALKHNLEDRLLIRNGKVNSFKGLFALNDGYVGLGIVFLFFLGLGTAVALTFDYSPASIAFSIFMIVLGIGLQVIFVKLMRAYTKEGRKILDHILGFKKYLETTEEQVFEALNPPDKTLELYEKYLPYAIALKCESKWARKFEDVITRAIENGYSPDYYRGLSSNHSYSSITQGISSGFASTVSSASTPPSSSGGGSSGGGFSGGGGGGGGGGGW